MANRPFTIMKSIWGTCEKFDERFQSVYEEAVRLTNQLGAEEE